MNATATRKLFVSFTGLLQLIHRKMVTEEELATGLFLFGCLRSHAIAPDETRDGADEREWVDRTNPEAGLQAHRQLIEALLKAETEHRAAWPKKDGSSRYIELNKLLVANGLPELPVNAMDDSNPGIENAVREQMPEQLEVTWRVW